MFNVIKVIFTIFFLFQFLAGINDRTNRKLDYATLLPPEDCYVSDVGSSSDDEEVYTHSLGNNYDPDLAPLPVPINVSNDIYSSDDEASDFNNIPDITTPHVPVDASNDNDGSDDDVPLSIIAASLKNSAKNQGKKNNRTNFKWKKEDFRHNKIPIDVEHEAPKAILSPLQYFQKFWDEPVVQYISEQTNFYSTLTTGTSINTSPNEIKAFMGIEILMGIIRMPSFEDYWSIRTRYSLIADVMPVKRFKKLRRLLHFQDNTAAANGDRLFKIRPMLDMIRANCIKTKGENLYSIDEMMISYKGTKAGNLRQYMPKKPKKWGFKMFVRAGVSGIVYDFFIYTGSTTFDSMIFSETEAELGSGGKVVIQLCKTIPNPSESFVYFDNWFTSLDLIVLLKSEYAINSLGTVRSNRLRGCTLEQDKSLLKKGRGSFDYKVDNNAGIAVVKWADTKCVTLASSCVSHTPTLEVKRYSKEEKKRVNVVCPQIIKQYNTHMGGVDLADMLIALYKTPYKSRRWYLGIFSQLIDICVNNAWLTYRRDNEALGNLKHDNLKTFRTSLALSLLKTEQKTNFRKSDFAKEQPSKKIRVAVTARPTDDIRYDQMGHFPTFTDKGRCRLCTNGQTTVFCQKCNVRLCFVQGQNSRNCFSIYHVKDV